MPFGALLKAEYPHDTIEVISANMISLGAFDLNEKNAFAITLSDGLATNFSLCSSDMSVCTQGSSVRTWHREILFRNAINQLIGQPTNLIACK